MIKTDGAGRREWGRIYGGTNDQEARAVRQTSDGYVAAGFVSSGGVITTVAGGGSGGDTGPATNARLDFPNSIAVDWRPATPVLYVAAARGVYASSNLGSSWSRFESTPFPRRRQGIENLEHHFRELAKAEDDAEELLKAIRADFDAVHQQAHSIEKQQRKL